MANKIKELAPIDYTSRDFETIKKELLEYAKIYYPDTVKDFNDASFASLMFDTVAYVGDILSFYLDYNVNETFMSTATEFQNILKHARTLGYKREGAIASHGEVSVFVIVPSNAESTGPDTDYIPILRKGTTFSSTSGVQYTLVEDIDFSHPNNEIVPATVNETTGYPTEFAIKSSGQVMSGQLATQILPVGDFERFLKVELPVRNVTEIMSVVDSEGHEYFEVDYLSQNIVFKALKNRNKDKITAPSILKAVPVPRRYVVEREGAQIFLQFGYGSDRENVRDSVRHPSEVVMQQHGRNYEVNKYFDPSKILESDKFGIAPSNTSLTVTYRANNRDDVNSAAGAVDSVSTGIFRFSKEAISTATKFAVKDSLEVTNPEPILGGILTTNSQELKRNALDFFASQNRAVTKQDYSSLVYQMPARFGSIKRCNLTHDNDSFKRNINLYVLMQGTDRFLTKANATIKQNLKVWLNQHKMINDTIDILDGKVINIGIDFTAVSDVGVNKYDLLNRCIINLTNKFSRPYDLGEPMYITDIYNVINDTPGIVDVVSVRIKNKSGGNYSESVYGIDQNLSPDGRMLITPEDAVIELRYPNKDIKGTIR
tara:strand:- start:1019 stop:2818 length:1800 start_codon:yes stop_codon:yes gene_type:complete